MNDGLLIKSGEGLVVIKKTMPEAAYSDKLQLNTGRRIAYLDSKEAVVGGTAQEFKLKMKQRIPLLPQNLKTIDTAEEEVTVGDILRNRRQSSILNSIADLSEIMPDQSMALENDSMVFCGFVREHESTGQQLGDMLSKMNQIL